MIEARKLGRTYGTKHVIRDLDLDVGCGDFLLLTGPNGSGKTTLLRLIAGLLVPTAGELDVRAPRERIGMLLERFDLWEARNQRADSFSRGMLQRLALCRTLLHEPELLVLDEPFSALDEDGAALLDRELGELRLHATFVVSTHDPDRLEPLSSQRLAFA